MSDIIQLLPDHIANQIAAGEVVQRPASVVKEILENAIDAGGQNIRLIIKDAGKTLIQVVDDGIGMTETDARMCFERHATSKIRKAEDLFSIKTMGFRGEAMASIAAVAHVELRTKKRDQEMGTQLIIEGSEVITQQPCQTNDGTSISIKNLFFNIPARRNFLKSSAVEMRHIIDEFQRVALAHPEIFFSLHHNNTKLFHLPKGNLRQRIVGILGNKVNAKLIPIEEETDIIKIYGYIGKPEAAKKTRGEQFFFVNNRFIRSSYLHHAILGAYEELLPAKMHPLYVVFFELNPAKIDVNVHPTKQEIKFEDERLVYNYLRVTIRHALAQNSITPTLEFDVESGISKHLNNPNTSSYTKDTSIKEFNTDHIPPIKKQPKIKETTTHPNLFSNTNSSGSKKKTTPKKEPSNLDTSNLKHWEKLYENLDQPLDESVAKNLEQPKQEIPFSNQDSEKFTSAFSSEKSATNTSNSQKKAYQLHYRYIIHSIKSGVTIIDQQAAHQRILYERYLNTLKNHNPAIQQLLFPQTITLSVQDAELLKGILKQVNQLGIDIKEFGNNSFVVHGLPNHIEQQNEQELINQLLEQFKENLPLQLDILENLARSFAAQSAIKQGQHLAPEEMQQLIDELFACQTPYQAPNGKKTFIQMSLEDIGKLFLK